MIEVKIQGKSTRVFNTLNEAKKYIGDSKNYIIKDVLKAKLIESELFNLTNKN